MNAVTLPAHSRLGPSGAHRWINCSGSPNLISKLGLSEDDGSEEAALGTICHEITAECLLEDREPWEYAGTIRKHGKFEFEIDEEMTPRIQKCLQYVQDTFAMYEPMGAILHIETKVYSELDPEAFGTADIRIEVPGLCIIVLDFKYGMVRVDPDDEQLKEYGYLSYERRDDRMKGAGEPKFIQLIIAQPRLPNANDWFRDAKFEPKELEDWFLGTVLPAMKATRDPNAPLTMGDWCKFCPANTSGKCPAVYKEIEKLPLEAHPTTFSDEELGRLKSMKPIIERFFKGLDGEALTRIRDQGKTVPGWKLVHKLGNRVWRTTVEVEEEDDNGVLTKRTYPIEDFARMKVGPNAFDKPVLKSPAQLEKLPGGASVTAIACYKPDTGLTLAPEDDTREVAVGLMARAETAGGVVV